MTVRRRPTGYKNVKTRVVVGRVYYNARVISNGTCRDVEFGSRSAKIYVFFSLSLSLFVVPFYPATAVRPVHIGPLRRGEKNLFQNTPTNDIGNAARTLYFVRYVSNA